VSHQWRWPTSPEELIDAQLALATAASPEPWVVPEEPTVAIGACVVCFPRGMTGPGARGDRAWAAAAVLEEQRVIAQATVVAEAGAPYIAGLLALREGPALQAAVRALAAPPSVLLVDGTGRDHPRRAGMALHLGAVLGLPTVGVTHRPLLAGGAWPDDAYGATAPLRLGGETVGAWLRTRRGARPLAVHAGWRTDLETAVEVVRRATSGHRTPEPFRMARRLARTARARASADLEST
jgi:deoxyribonuclease V